MKTITVLMVVAVILAVSVAQPALAHGSQGMEGHAHGEMADHPAKGEMDKTKDMFLVKKEIDGYAVSFHVMKAREGMQRGGSHNFMVKVEKDGKALTDIAANSRVIHPDGTSESKMLMKMGDWYMVGYDFAHAGQYQLMVLFKTVDGSKHFGGVYYTESEGDQHEHHH